MLRRRGLRIGRSRIERLMRQAGLRGLAALPRPTRTTDSRHAYPIAPNRLGRNFVADRPSQVWLADLTYIATGGGWLYLAAVLDLHTVHAGAATVVGQLRAAWLRSRQTDLVPDKGQFRRRFLQSAQLRLSDNVFSGSRSRYRHHLSATLLDGRLETAGPGCYDAVAIAQAAGFRMRVMSRIRQETIVP